MHVDRARTEVVAAGQCHPRPALAGEQGAEHHDRGAHALDQLVGRLGDDRRRTVDREVVRRGPLDGDAHRAEQVAHAVDVVDGRDVVEYEAPHSANVVAAISFSTEFFAPAIGTEPRSGPDRRTRMRSTSLSCRAPCWSSPTTPPTATRWRSSSMNPGHDIVIERNAAGPDRFVVDAGGRSPGTSARFAFAATAPSSSASTAGSPCRCGGSCSGCRCAMRSSTRPRPARDRGGRRRSSSTRGRRPCSACLPAWRWSRATWAPCSSRPSRSRPTTSAPTAAARERRSPSLAAASCIAPPSSYQHLAGPARSSPRRARDPRRPPAALAAALGALAPSIGALAATQLVATGCVGATALLIAITSAEEMPAGARAYGISLITMAGGLGAGMCVWVLPADLRRRRRAERHGGSSTSSRSSASSSSSP